MDLHEKRFTVACQCQTERYSKDHTVDFDYWKDKDYGDNLTISTGLNHYKSFFGRLKVALFYVLGIDNTHIFYTETMLDKAEVLRLKSFIDEVAESFDKKE